LRSTQRITVDGAALSAAIAGMVNVAVMTVANASFAAPLALPLKQTAQASILAVTSDRSLKEYDQAHPDCDLWTDWRKLCSRMGPDGATTCTIDSHHPAKPSAPFCADSKLGHHDSLAEAASRRRFCAKWDDAEYDRRSGAVYRTCKFYKAERPFNGTSIEPMASPYCLAWTYPNHPYSPLSCSKWSPDIQCAHPVGGDEPPKYNGASLLIDIGTLQIVRPVWGTYCHTMR
jgi:hypothetical protein